MTIRKKHKQDDCTNNWQEEDIIVSLEPKELQILNERLKAHGYKTLEALVKDLISHKFPPRLPREPAQDVDYLRAKIRKVMALSGQAGLVAKIVLLAGLTEVELLYVHRGEICNAIGCECYRLHVVDNKNGLTIVIVNWVRKCKRCYLAILPTRLWQCLRDSVVFDSDDTDKASIIATRSVGICFGQLQRIFCKVMSSTMSASEVKVLNGSASLEAAKDCRMNRLDSIADKYCKAWEKFGLVVPVIRNA